MSLHKKIYDLRTQKGWSQSEVAHQLDVSQPAYNKWETGQAKPTIQNLQKISNIFDIDFYNLLSELLSNVDFSNAKFDGHSYVVHPVESTIHFQSEEIVNRVVENQKNITLLIENQNKLIERLLGKE